MVSLSSLLLAVVLRVAIDELVTTPLLHVLCK